MLPPALMPPIEIRVGSILNFCARAGEEMYLRAMNESRIPVGKGIFRDKAVCDVDVGYRGGEMN